jgi:hypothetical protein
MLLYGGSLDGKTCLEAETFKAMATVTSARRRARLLYPGDGFGFGYGCGVRTDPGDAEPPPVARTTHPRHLAGHAVGADRAPGFASSVRTASRSSCVHAATARSYRWQRVTGRRLGHAHGFHFQVIWKHNKNKNSSLPVPTGSAPAPFAHHLSASTGSTGTALSTGGCGQATRFRDAIPMTNSI